MLALIGSSAFGAAMLFGFRHGFDWDYLAALTDLTGSQADARRSMRLATTGCNDKTEGAKPHTDMCL